jgi:hypothetical protein
MTKKWQCLFAYQTPFAYITRPPVSYYIKGNFASLFRIILNYFCNLLNINQLQIILKIIEKKVRNMLNIWIIAVSLYRIRNIAIDYKGSNLKS